MLIKKIVFLLLLCCLSGQALAEKASIDPDNLFPKVVVEGEFDNTIFHRVIKGFIAQGGGYDEDFTMKQVKKNIINEAGNGLKNEEGTIAMAKENRPHSANRQFFFNLSDNSNLDPGRRWGYAVFGSVVEGLEVVQAMGQVETEFDEGMGWDDVPKEPVILIKATLLPSE